MEGYSSKCTALCRYIVRIDQLQITTTKTLIKFGKPQLVSTMDTSEQPQNKAFDCEQFLLGFDLFHCWELYSVEFQSWIIQHSKFHTEGHSHTS